MLRAASDPHGCARAPHRSPGAAASPCPVLAAPRVLAALLAGLGTSPSSPRWGWASSDHPSRAGGCAPGLLRRAWLMASLNPSRSGVPRGKGGTSTTAQCRERRTCVLRVVGFIGGGGTAKTTTRDLSYAILST